MELMFGVALFVILLLVLFWLLNVTINKLILIKN